MQNTGKREYALDVLKTLIIITVLVHHYQSKFNVSFGPLDFGNGKFYFGFMAEILFIISGYFSVSAIEKIQNGMSFKKYFSGKYLRIVPVAAICTAVYSLIFIVFRLSDRFPLWDMYLTLLGVQAGGIFNATFINSHLWYSSVLLICYVVFYAGTRFSIKKGIKPCYVYAFLAILGTAVIYTNTALPFLNWSSGRGYMSFFTGLILGQLLRDKRPNVLLCTLCAAVIAALTVIMVFKWDWVAGGIHYIMNFIYYPALLVLLKSSVSGRIFRFPFMGTLSQIAFNVYIWHLEILSFAEVLDDRLALGINFNAFTTELVLVLIQLAVGTASYYLIDKPLSACIKKRVLDRITD